MKKIIQNNTWGKNRRTKCKTLSENGRLITAIRNKEVKKAVHAKIARKQDANVCITNFLVRFSAYRARVGLWDSVGLHFLQAPSNRVQ